MSTHRLSSSCGAIVEETFVTPSGIRLGYERWGEGPRLVLGAFSDQRSNWAQVRPLLAPHVAGHAISRRGRGRTDATVGHALADEAADVVALIQRLRAPVHLLGHSYGALVALHAATAAPGLVRSLMLYEPPWPSLIDPETLARLSEGEDRARFARRVFVEVLHVPASEIAALEKTPDWQDILTDAPATLRDMEALSRHSFAAEDHRGLAMPVLLQTGTESPADLYVTQALRAVLTDVRLELLEGQAHEAMTTAPDLYARSVLSFVAEIERREQVFAPAAHAGS